MSDLSSPQDQVSNFIVNNVFLLKRKVKVQRGTYICAHAWIFFKLCILMTHYIQTMKMYLSN